MKVSLQLWYTLYYRGIDRPFMSNGQFHPGYCVYEAPDGAISMRRRHSSAVVVR